METAKFQQTIDRQLEQLMEDRRDMSWPFFNYGNEAVPAPGWSVHGEQTMHNHEIDVSHARGAAGY